MKLAFKNINIAKYKVNLKDIKDLVKKIVTSEGYKLGEIIVVNTDEKDITLINKEFLSHDYVTDIITFSYNRKEIISGDLVICLDKIRRNALIYNKSVKNELIRVIIHGILHLMSYNDNTRESKKIMKGKEDYFMEYFLEFYV